MPSRVFHAHHPFPEKRAYALAESNAVRLRCVHMYQQFHGIAIVRPHAPGSRGIFFPMEFTLEVCLKRIAERVRSKYD